jgi:hypothetical protein
MKKQKIEELKVPMLDDHDQRAPHSLSMLSHEG